MDIGVTAFLHDRSISPTRFASAAEERGFTSLYLPEHTHLPVAEAAPPGLVAGVTLEDYRRSLDPMVALAAAAAVTDRIRLGTGVCLVAQHDPVVLGKQLATLDQLSGGRTVLGVGYGWNRREAADHGVDFAARREVAREKLLCMQALWTMEEAAFHGHFVELPPCYSWPKPLQAPRIRTLVGAAAGRATFETVAEVADGWMPIGGAGIADALPALRQVWAEAGREDEPLHVVAFGTLPDEAKLDHLRRSGVTEVVLRVPSGPEADVLRVLDEYTRYLPPA
jgi:probable F420-dependent oxidoreductase